MPIKKTSFRGSPPPSPTPPRSPSPSVQTASSSTPAPSLKRRRSEDADSFSDAKRPKMEPRPQPSPSADQVLGRLNPGQELRHAARTAEARYAKQGATARPDHLDGQTTVRKTQRREAEIQSPTDRLRLAAEPRDGTNHYTQLKQDGQVVGRIQDPTQKGAAADERFTYQHGKAGPPSYPAEAAHLRAQPGTDPQKFQGLKDTMQVKPGASNVPNATTANIIGISEQRRSASMGLFSAQRIDHATRHPQTPDSVFGQASTQGGKKVNTPGTLPASGTGAKGEYGQFRQSLDAGQVPAPGTPARRIHDNVAQQHTDLMRAGYDPKAMQRMEQEGLSEQFRQDAATARMRSAATRDAAKMTGQLPYDLRSLKQPQDGGEG